MSYYKINKTTDDINEKDLLLNLSAIKDKSCIDDFVCINESLYFYLKKTKEQINNNKNWDIYKKYTNPYEFIHTSYDKTNYISKKKPLSRAYYKMIELIQYFNLFKLYENKNIKSFHLAEGPGGFIEAFVDVRKNKFDQYYGMTLINNNSSIPAWKKSTTFLNKNENVKIETGPENGNLYSYNNLQYIIKKHSDSCDIITGDGGFDFSIDFSRQEANSLHLIYSQIIFALNLQKNNGIFIIKFFDLFIKSTLDLIYLLSNLYENVYITKPKTSRYANSEKYIVCLNFNRNKFLKISNKLENIFKVLEKIDLNKYIISSFLSINYNFNFNKSIQEINSIIGEQQLNVINNTLLLIKKSNINSKIENEKNKNIRKCIDWCIEHNIPFNEYKRTNIFTN
jgi:23S rRNA U2552 (ribose-2'-O)-methylase RlmE/FtsJ